MAEDLLHRIIAIPEDYGSIHVNAIERQGDDLNIFLEVTADEDPDLPRDIVVRSSLFSESTLAPGYYAEVIMATDHVLLWQYNKPHAYVSFYGEAMQPLAVVGALFERHTDLVGSWIPFQRYLNGGRLSELIAGRYGLLAQGPEPLIFAYEEVMQQHGFSTAHHASDKPVESPKAVLIFHESFVIAESFNATAL